MPIQNKWCVGPLDHFLWSKIKIHLPGTADQAIENPESDKEPSEWKCTVATYPDEVTVEVQRSKNFIISKFFFSMGIVWSKFLTTSQ